MADDIQDLGTKERLTIRPNWASPNQVELVTSKDIVSFPSTIVDIFLFSELHKNKIKFKYLCEDKEVEYALIDFYNSKKGRLERFWIQGYKEEFVLSQSINNTDTIINVHDNGFDLVHKGHERLYIELKNGNLITRKIINVIKVGNELQLTVSSIAQDIAIVDVGVVGRIYLVRFNKDVLEVVFNNSVVAEAEVDFVEVVREYDI